MESGYVDNDWTNPDRACGLGVLRIQASGASRNQFVVADKRIRPTGQW